MAVRNIKCAACGAAMRFDPHTGKLLCDNCGSTREIDESTADQIWQEVDESKVSWMDWGDYDLTQDMNPPEEGSVLYTCPSCGAEIVVDPTVAASRCPYCDNNVVLKDRVGGVQKPHAVIPFQIDKTDVPELLQAFFRKKKFLPRAFRQEAKLERIQGIYVPYWLFDCNIRGTMEFTGERVLTFHRGEDTIITTEHWLLHRSGNLYFDKVPVDGSIRLDDAMMESLEPYDYSKLMPYEDEYLSGFVAEKYDEEPKTSMNKAAARMMNSAADYLSGNESFLNVRLRSNEMKVREASARYVLLPVYLFHVRYKGKEYRFAVNGQSGKVTGDLPSSNGKIALVSAAAGLAAALIGTGGGILFFGG